MMRFSDRIGITKKNENLISEEIPEALRNLLWTVFTEEVYLAFNNEVDLRKKSQLLPVFRTIWVDFFEYPIDKLPVHNQRYGTIVADRAFQKIRDWFYESEWYEVLNFVEFIGRIVPDTQIRFNSYLTRKLSAYRFLDGVIVPVTSTSEIEEIEKALDQSDQFLPVRTHLKSAIRLLSDHKSPDYRNSIKESISAVESLAKLITNERKATLGQLVEKISVPKSLEKAMSSLYGYTSNESGIRHALLEKTVDVGVSEARFMLITCSAFINYIISRV